MLDAVRSIFVTGIGKVGIMLLPGVDDEQCVTPRRFEQPRNRLNETRDGRDVKAGAIEHSTTAAEVVLHIDDHDGSPARIEADRFRASSNG